MCTIITNVLEKKGDGGWGMVAINRLTQVKIWGNHIQASPTKHLKEGSITTISDFWGQFLLLRFFWEKNP